MANQFKNPGAASDALLEEQEKASRVGNKHPDVFYVDKNGKRWDYSSPEIRNAFKKLKERATAGYVYADKNNNIVDKRDSARKAANEKWIKAETEKQKAEFNPQIGHNIHFIFGNGGTGKSTFINKQGLQKLNPSFLMDSDIFVENYLPETSDKNNPERAFNTHMVHEESSDLRKKMFDPLEIAGYNIISPKIMATPDALKKYKDLGYKIKGTFLDASLDTALKRGLKRYVESGNRIVPTAAYRSREELRKMWQDLIDSGYMDEWEHYDADSPDYSLKLINKNK